MRQMEFDKVTVALQISEKTGDPLMFKGQPMKQTDLMREKKGSTEQMKAESRLVSHWTLWIQCVQFCLRSVPHVLRIGRLGVCVVEK